jgi:hypothetical protein
MSLRRLARKVQWLCVPLAVLLSVQGVLYGQEGCAACSGTAFGTSCGTTSCRHIHCPPPFKYCMHGGPCIKFHYGCPLPVCPPCNAPNWGYYQPCWRPWPWPPNWAHCPYPVPASQVAPCPQAATAGPGLPGTAAPPGQLPSPRPRNELPGAGL